MISPSAAIAAPSAASATPAKAAEPELHFLDVLSALNPLQYLPVVGTIYRAITGDTVPEPLRAMGCMIASGLMGGPIGAAISAASSLIQHVAGIDLDQLGHDALASLGLVDNAPETAIATAVQTPDIKPTLARSASAAEAPLPIAPPTDLPDMVQRQAAFAAYGQTLYTYGPGAGHA